MLAMQISGRLLERCDGRLIIGAGLLLLALSLHQMSRFSIDVPASAIISSGFIQGLGLGCIFVPLSAIAFSTLRPELRGEGTALYSLLRNVGSSVGIALAFAYQDYGTKMAHSVLVENINPFNPALLGVVNSHVGVLGAASVFNLEVEIQRQSAVIGMLGVFHYMTYGVLLALPFLLLFKRAEKSRLAGPLGAAE